MVAVQVIGATATWPPLQQPPHHHHQQSRQQSSWRSDDVSLLMRRVGVGVGGRGRGGDCCGHCRGVGCDLSFSKSATGWGRRGGDGGGADLSQSLSLSPPTTATRGSNQLPDSSALVRVFSPPRGKQATGHPPPPNNNNDNNNNNYPNHRHDGVRYVKPSRMTSGWTHDAELDAIPLPTTRSTKTTKSCSYGGSTSGHSMLMLEGWRWGGESSARVEGGWLVEGGVRREGNKVEERRGEGRGVCQCHHRDVTATCGPSMTPPPPKSTRLRGGGFVSSWGRRKEEEEEKEEEEREEEEGWVMTRMTTRYNTIKKKEGRFARIIAAAIAESGSSGVSSLGGGVSARERVERRRRGMMTWQSINPRLWSSVGVNENPLGVRVMQVGASRTSVMKSTLRRCRGEDGANLLMRRGARWMLGSEKEEEREGGGEGQGVRSLGRREEEAGKKRGENGRISETEEEEEAEEVEARDRDESSATVTLPPSLPPSPPSPSSPPSPTSSSSSSSSSLSKSSQTSLALGGTAIGLGIVVGAVALVAGIGTVFRAQINSFLMTFSSVLDGLGFFGYILFVFVYAALEVLAIPAIPLTMTAGLLFGVVLGTVLVSIASTLAATIAFLIARYVARDKIIQLTSKYPKFAAIDKAIGRDSFRVVALLRLSPLMPFSLGNYFYGLTSIRLLPYIAASWIGMLPGTWTYICAGSVGRSIISQPQQVGEGGPSVLSGLAGGGEIWALALGVFVTLVATAYITGIAKDAIEDVES
ncbi:hypothetical protein CBR_g39503 [Chara braunii]|uniref:VTT domain-containing protein n=1 Tax=Chara braunii TaxID=69332 RepID=A0A388LS11_CHABU|nr:hypothetical protein CBR_g39503 [Chara braunii]|eukprot:GBG85039.1 hypothetical protein CBR_g39503 [Chara braunii]